MTTTKIKDVVYYKKLFLEVNKWLLAHEGVPITYFLPDELIEEVKATLKEAEEEAN